MRVLVACEFSGIVREAFRANGHDAWSCDLLPTETEGPHIQGDVLSVLDNGWDLMIGHPPCTYLSNAGVRWFNEERYGEKARDRKALRAEAFTFVVRLMECSVGRVCIENPVGYLNSTYRKPDQIIQPYYFGDPHLKGTCLWLKGLPHLSFSEEMALDKPDPIAVTTRRPSRHYQGGEPKKHYWTQMHGSRSGDDRRKERSRTFPGIAKAMADQWGGIAK